MSDQEDYQDYGDEEDMYIDYTQDDIAGFTFKDIGEDSRITFRNDDILNIDLTTLELRGITPLELFKLQVKEYSKEVHLHLNPADIAIIYKTIDKLHFIHLKNSLAYVYGYALHISRNPVEYLHNTLAEHIKGDTKVTMNEIIKYSRLWKEVLLK